MKVDAQPAEGVVAEPEADEAEALKKPDAQEPKEKSGEQATPEGDETADKPKKKHWAEKRFDELTYHRRQAERDRDYWRDIAVKQSSQAQTPSAQTQAQASTKPTPDKYPNYEDYIEAITDWKVEERDRKRREETELKERQGAEQKRRQTFAELEHKAMERYGDYEEIAYHVAPINEVMAEVIRRSEFGPEIAYYLGKNLDKGQQIAQMTDPHSVALAIGRIEAQLEKADSPPSTVVAFTPKTPTGAPPPPKTISGSAAVQKDPEDMSMKEWVRARETKLRKRKE